MSKIDSKVARRIFCCLRQLIDPKIVDTAKLGKPGKPGKLKTRVHTVKKKKMGARVEFGLILQCNMAKIHLQE